MQTKITTATFSLPLARLLEALDDRSQDIVKRRFGLDSGSCETLESIGREYGITRERVRQIEAQAKKALRTRLEVLNEISLVLERIFRERGGILPEQQVVEMVQNEVDKQAMPTIVSFYLELLPPYEYQANDPLFVAHWRYPEFVSDKASEIAKAGQNILNEAKKPKTEQEFIDLVRQSVYREQGDGLPMSHVQTWLMASRHVAKNPFGEWGLVGWAEMTPRGVGDKAYAVLRRHGKPEHFRNIAQMINEARFDAKIANPQTVHNELIKDGRFVLVGRGLYGLTQWGYVPGTVADVVESVLRKAGQPLTREEIVDRVLAQRMVKKNTILLSLQDLDRFTKTKENSYTLNKK